MKNQAVTKKTKTKDNHSIPAVRSKFYVFDRRASLISGRVVGLNLQGHAQPKKAFFFTLTKEVKTTIFLLELSIANIRWTISKSFEELRQFYAYIRSDESLYRGRDLLVTHFPAGEDGEDDVMLLVERREMIEAFFKEVLQQIDPEVYAPLALFIDSPPHFDHMRHQTKRVIKYLRSMSNKKKLLMRLFEFYSKDLMDFVCRLENGIEVYNIDDRFAGEEGAINNNNNNNNNNKNNQKKKVPSVLWLDVCEEPGLSRLCLAPRAVFDLPAVDIYEDARLANGVYLSDIAEVRKGASSEAFRRQSFFYFQRAALSQSMSSEDEDDSWYDASACVSVVGSERSLAVELTFSPETDAAETVKMQNTQANALLSSSPSSSSSSSSSVKKGSVHRVNDVASFRLLFVEMLNLLALQSLSSEDVAQRRRRFQKLRVHESLRAACAQAPLRSPLFVATHRIDLAQLARDGAQTEALLAKGIEVEEEVVSPEFGVQIASKMMRYDARRRVLWITSLQHHEPQQRLRLEQDFDLWHASSRLDSEDEEDEGLEEEEEEEESGDEEDKDETGGYEDEENSGSEDVSANGQRHRKSKSKSKKGSKSRRQEEIEQFLGQQSSSYVHHHHHQWQLTSSASRFLHVDDISEIRPGRVSSYVDHPEQDACVLSIIGSATIVVLPVPSLALRDRLVQRFQAFVFQNRRFDELMTNDTPHFFQPRHFTRKHQRVIRRQWREQQKLLEQSLLSKRDAEQQQNSNNNNDDDIFQVHEKTLPSAATPASSLSHLLAQHKSPPHTPQTRFSDTHVHETHTPHTNPSGTRATPHSHAHRRHSHSHEQSPLASSLPLYLSPMTGLSTSLTASYLTPPPSSQLSSTAAVSGIFSHGRQSRSVSAVRRSSTSSSTKGKSSLSEAFSFS